MGVWELVAGFAIWIVATTLSGALGFGGGIVAVPFLVLINPEFVPIPLLLQGVFFTGSVTWRERRAIDIPALKWAAIGLLPGVALGTITPTSVNKDALSFASEIDGSHLVVAAVLACAAIAGIILSGPFAMSWVVKAWSESSTQLLRWARYSSCSFTGIKVKPSCHLMSPTF